MVKVLILKQGGLGDIIQSLGAYMDISEHHETEVDVLTTQPHKNFFKHLPFVNNVFTMDSDRKKDMIFLYKTLPTHQYDYVYCLPDFAGLKTRRDGVNQLVRQFVLNYLVFSKAKYITLNTTIEKQEILASVDLYTHKEWNEIILKKHNIKIKHCTNRPLERFVDKTFTGHNNITPYIFIAPYFSNSTTNHVGYRGWPHFKTLMLMIKRDFPSLNLVVVPGRPAEKECANLYPATQIFDQNAILAVPQLMKVIQDATYCICLDSAPDKIASELGQRGVVICGKHSRTPRALGLDTDCFQAIHYKDRELNDVTVDEVYSVIKKDLEKIVHELKSQHRCVPA